MGKSPKPGAVLFAKDLPCLARFYTGVTGLVISHSEDRLIVLESANQQLVLHGIPPSIAKAIVITAPPKLRKDTAIKLVFPVTSIADARRRAPSLGGAVNPGKDEFTARGFTACDGHDPEGNLIQFRESASARG